MIHRHEDPERFRFLLAIFIALMLLSIAMLFGSCKTTQVVDNSASEYGQKDNIKNVYIRDTVYLEKTIEILAQDEGKAESSEDASIVFTPTGGTYNALTGEATGVTSVSSSKREKEQRSIISSYKEKEKEWSATEKILRDSIKELNIKEKKAISIKEKPVTAWRTWILACIISFLLGFFLIFGLKKVPYLKPFLRKM